MAVFICGTCGEAFEAEADAGTAVCPSCGTEQALPEADGEAAPPEEQKTDAGRKDAPKRKKRAGRILAILVPVIAVLAALAALIPTAVLPAVRRSSAYSAAEDLYRAGQYAEAMEAFEALGGYRDSAEQAGYCADAIMEPQYEDAHHLFENGQYAEAMEAFGALGGYQDSAERAEACRTILDGRYEAALEAFEAGYYETAREIFEALDGYRDSAEFVSRCEDATAQVVAERLEQLQDAQVGGTVLFGTFEQDNDFENGMEEIEWIVLAREDDRILVISRYGLAQRAFNGGSSHRVTWENCSLREWLNGEFLETSFSEEELARILTTDLRTLRDPENSSSPGVDTQDRVFLLDLTEAETYFSSDEDRVCERTRFSLLQGLWFDDINNSGWWWLRSPGFDSTDAAYVNSEGKIIRGGWILNDSACNVRPAMWIDLGS